MESIPCSAVLEPLGLEQYTEALTLNLSSGGKGLSVRKLRSLQIKHLSHMSVTNFADQRAIVARVKELLAENESIGKSKSDLSDATGAKELPLPDTLNSRVGVGEEAKKTRSQRRSKDKGSFEKGRRPSFDYQKNFDKIKSMRGEMDSDKKAAKVEEIRRKSFDPEKKTEKNELLKEVENNVAEDERDEARMQPKKRKSLTGNTQIGFKFNASNAETDKRAALKDKAMQYGNSAQRTAKADDGLHRIGQKVMKTFKDEVSCQRSSLIFFDSLKGDMFFYADEKIFRFDINKGIAGYVAMTGEMVNVPDAYADERFNSSVDQQTGFKTKTILCAPIRSRSGDGVVAVIQMLNKKGDECFTELDEEVIRNCAFRVSEALDLQFQTLVSAQIDMERMSLDGLKNSKETTLAVDLEKAEPKGDELPLQEEKRVIALNTDTDPFAEERRKRVKEYGAEVREAKVGM